MRVVLVGPASDRARLREALGDEAPDIDIVGETTTMADARALSDRTDAFVLPARPSTGFAIDGESDASGEHDAPVEVLTARERDVVSLLALGLSNKAIAARLGISDQTAKFHVASIIGKLGADNRTDALARAARRGLIDL